MNRISTCFIAVACAAFSATASLRANPVTVQEQGIGSVEVVSISSSRLGNNLWVYAGIIDLSVDGAATNGFCVDPWHWSIGGLQPYTLEPLAIAPKPPGPMGPLTALEIKQIWARYYSPSMSASSAAGMQIAIWDLVGASIQQSSLGASWFTLDSANDYGATTMIAWVQDNPHAPVADLVAVSGPGQDYAIQNVPEAGTTFAFLGLALFALFAFSWKPRNC